MSKGKVRLSLDFECGWGVAQGGAWRANQAAGIYRNLRPALRRFTSRLDELEISATWAVVAGMVTPPESRDITHLRGQFANDMATFLAEADRETVDGRDLLEMVISMRCKQSFGTHTFSHLLFSDPEQGPEVVLQDLMRASEVSKSLGLDFSRIVFPRNHAGHFSTLQAVGITHARMPAINGHNPIARPGRIRRMLGAAIRPPSQVCEIKDTSGVILHHATEFLNWGAKAGNFKRMLHWRRVKQALAAAATGQDVHFWMHPFNLAEGTGLDHAVDKLLLEIGALRDAGKIDVMGF
jgi:hypothetical protein